MIKHLKKILHIVTQYYIIPLSCIYQFSVDEHTMNVVNSLLLAVDSNARYQTSVNGGVRTHGDQHTLTAFVCIMKLDGFACGVVLSANQQ